MQDIVKKMDLSPHMRQSYEKLAEEFTRLMPDALYMSFYELAEKTGTSAGTWETFLDNKEIEQYIEAKVLKITEVNARAALNKLANASDLSTQEVAAFRELISKSKLIQAARNNKPVVVLTHVPLE